MADPATAVFTRRVLPGCGADYERLARNATAAAARSPGHLAATVLHEAGRPEYTIVYSFADRTALDAWLDSPTRQRFAAEAEPLSIAHHELPRITGLETWFTLPRVETIKPPPRWKMWLVSLAALYPLVVIFQGWLAPLLTTWPLPARAAVFPLILLTLMTYAIMPVITRLAAAWLYPQRPRAVTAQGHCGAHVPEGTDAWLRQRAMVTTPTDADHVAGTPLPRIGDDEMRARMATARPYTAVLLPKTAKFVRPNVDPTIWEHGRRNMALVQHGVLAVALAANDSTDWAGLAVLPPRPKRQPRSSTTTRRPGGHIHLRAPASTWRPRFKPAQLTRPSGPAATCSPMSPFSEDSP